MANGTSRARYTGEFKQQVIEDIQKNKLSQHKASAKYGVDRAVIRRWERVYLEEGAEGLSVERRGWACSASGAQKGLPKQVEEDLISQNRRLRAEVAYLKNLQALVLKDEQHRRKKHW